MSYLNRSIVNTVMKCRGISCWKPFSHNKTKPVEYINNVSSINFCQKQFHTNNILLNQQNAAEEQLIKVLAEAFPQATDIAVVDVSGGCGSMYEVHVEAPDFKNLRIVKQHQMVTAALQKQIKSMHGIRISTSASGSCSCC